MKKSDVVRRYTQRVMCPKCAHLFKTASRATWITCGKCHRKFKRLKNLVIDENK
ncbi:unnamed protein product [marine sediment metagenome]|uniref:Uncharacterized protein n=1 Tax=marine sediment metagenome TaxID=412755 RepID=X1JNA9_9ZZZZ